MFEKVKLENGATIVMQKMENFRSVSMGIFVRNGSIDETNENNGISHFIEHMLFKGTKTRSAKDIAEQMDNVGGQLNAFTSKEYTCYYVRALDEHIDIAIDMLLDMLINSKFDEEDIKKEAKVILEEIDMYEDTPDDIIFSKLHQKIWKDSPIGLSILGTKENISKFTKKDFMKYLSEKYVGENIVISIAGNFDKDKVLEKIKPSLLSIPKGKRNIALNKNYGYNKSSLFIEKDIEQLHLGLAFKGIPINSPYNYAMSLFNALFGGGISSILFQKLREEHGLAYSIYSYNTNYLENGIFNIYVGLNKTQLKKTISIIKDEIKELKTIKISKEQIEKTKQQVKSSYIMGIENTSGAMSSLGRSLLLLDKIKTPTEIINEINKIKPEDIDYIIENVLNLDDMSISLVGNLNGIDTNRLI